MKKRDGILVSREYLERLDAAVFGTKKERPAKRRRRNLSGIIRPVIIKGEFSTVAESGRNYIKAPARFIENGEEGTELSLYALETSDATATGAQTFAIYRGRWYALTIPAEEVEICVGFNQTQTSATVYRIEDATIELETLAAAASASTETIGDTTTYKSATIPYSTGYLRAVLVYKRREVTATNYEPIFKKIRVYK